MSFLKKLLGGTFESNRDDGETLFGEGNFGEARLAFEKALTKSKGVTEAEVLAVRDRVRDCRLELARGQLARADEAVADGEIELALELLAEAQEICDESEIVEASKDRRQRFESVDARSLVRDAEEITEEELLAIIAGTWTDAQAEEYAAMPDDLHEALLAAHDREFERAAELLTGVVARPDLPVIPCFTWLELGRVRLLAQDEGGAIEALDTFLETVEDDDEDIGLQVEALNLKATALGLSDRLDEAKEQLIRTTRLAPEDHNVFLALGVFLRGREEYEGAVNALERALELMGQMHPDFRVIRELGFTYLAMDRKEEAMQSLGAVVEHLASRGEHRQFDPETTMALARLHEEKGDIMEAADLYRHLAVGYDTRNHFSYNLEAARLLGLAGGQESLAERYFTRSTELAEGDEQKALVEKIRSRGARR